MSFRAKLRIFALVLIVVLGGPVLYFEVQRPWQALRQLLDATEACLLGLAPTLDEADLVVVNRFSATTLQRMTSEAATPSAWKTLPNQALCQAFNLTLTRGALPTEAELQGELAAHEVDSGILDYAALQQAHALWAEQFARHPEVLAILRRYKTILQTIHSHFIRFGLGKSNIYLMHDAGPAAPGFADSIAFIVESQPWWEACYAGHPYNLVETDTEDWRASYLPEFDPHRPFHHSKVADPDNWYLPKFDRDEWGLWFSGWHVLRVPQEDGTSGYTLLTIDFDASVVRNLMVHVALRVTAVTLLLLIAVAIAIHQFSGRLTRPIGALTQGADAVMTHHFGYTVPVYGQDEFRHLTEIFNHMIRWVGERVNLKETLTKLLSEELAERAAKEGLVLGGQTVECTILFTDFAGFSTLTRKMTAAETVELLNLYFGELIPIVKEEGGFPDKYIGDAIVAIFGAPVRDDEHAQRAVRAAVRMQQRLRALNEERRREGKIVFEMRIGLNSGQVVAGAIGCDLKLEYTSIGETVNLANRMEAACTIGHVLVSHHTQARLAGDLPAGAVVATKARDAVVKGYSEPVPAYDIWTHDLSIAKAEDFDQPTAFYRYEPRA